MRRRFGLMAAVALLAAVKGATAEPYTQVEATPAVAVAEDTLLRSEVNQLRARLAALESTVAQPTPAGGAENVAPGTDPMYQDTQSAPVYTGAPMFVYQDQDNWIGGFSSYVLKAHWSQGSPAYTRTTTTGGGNFGGTNNVDFSYDYQVTPALWFGYLHSSGNGVRVNWFQYNQNAVQGAVVGANQTINDAFTNNLYTFLPPTAVVGFSSGTPGNIFRFASSLQVLNWDIEAIKRVNTTNWTWMASAGVRYLYLNQSYNETVTSAAGTQFAALSSRHFFNGAGPTLSLYGRRALGGRGFGLYGTGRVSSIFGNTTSSLGSASTTGSGVPTSGNAFLLSSWGTLPITEIEFGVDFRRRIGRTTFIFDNGLVGQNYFGAGTLSNTSAVSGNSSTANLGLFGVRSSIGFIY